MGGVAAGARPIRWNNPLVICIYPNSMRHIYVCVCVMRFHNTFIMIIIKKDSAMRH